MEGKISKSHRGGKSGARGIKVLKFRGDAAIMEEIIQASKARIAELNKVGVAQGRIGIAEPARQHLPVLTNMEEYDDWVKEATSYVMDKRLVREKQNKEIVGREITIENLFQDVTTGDGIIKKCSHVMVLGAAGMGKTTLLKRIALYCGEGILKGKLAIMLEFRTFPLEEKIPPCEVLLGGIFSDRDNERMKQRYQWIMDNQDKILFIIDSLDTLPFDLDSERPRIAYHTPASVDVILHNLLARDLFPKSLIISSSREYKVRKLHPSVRPDRCVLLDGLKEDSVKDLIDGFLGDDKGTEVKEHIETKCPNVWPLLSIPVVLFFTMISFGEDGFKPETMSGILIKFFICLIHSPHAHVKNILTVLGKLMPLSLDGIRKECVLFTPEDLKSFGLDPKEVTDLGILIPQSHGTFFSAKLMQNDRFFLYFNHQTEQECLAALTVLSMSLSDFESFIEREFSERKFTVVRLIIGGILLNGEVLEAVLQAGLCEVPDVHKKKNILIQSLGVALRKCQQQRFEKDKLLELFINLSECREGVAELIRSSVKEIDLEGFSLSPSDAQAVAFVMKQCDYLKAVLLNGCKLNYEKMNILMRTIMPSNIKIVFLNVGANKFEKKWMCQLAKICNHCKTESLAVDSCNLNSEHLEEFLDGASGLKLTKFNINDNENLGAEGSHLLGKLVKNHDVKILDAGRGSIRGCGSVEKFIEGLGDAKMDELDLVDRTGPPYTRFLLDLLPHVEKKLCLHWWKINESQQQELQQRLNEIGSPSLEVTMTINKRNRISLKASLMNPASDTTGRDCPSGVDAVKDAPTEPQTDVEQAVVEHYGVTDDGIETAASGLIKDETESEETTTSNENDDESETIATAEESDVGTEAENTDTTGRDCPSGFGTVKDASTESQTDAEQDFAARISAEIERRIKTESTKSKAVGTEGGFIVNFGSKVTFFTGAYDKETEVQTSLITDFSDCPKDRVPIAPSIKCSPSGKLNKPALVEIDHWAFPTGNHVYVDVYRKDDEDSERRFFKKICIEANQKISFYTEHFSIYEFLVKCTSWVLSAILRPFFLVNIQNHVYINGVDQSIACVCCLKDDKVKNDVVQTLTNGGFVPLLPLPEISQADRSEQVEIQIECFHPENLRILPDIGSPGKVHEVKKIKRNLSVNEVLSNSYELFSLQLGLRTGDLGKYEGMLRFKYSQTSEKKDKSHTLQKKWPLQQQASTHPIDVQHQSNIQITAGNLNIGGQMTTTEIGTASRTMGGAQTGNELSEQISRQRGGTSSNVTAGNYNAGQMTSNQYDATTQVFGK